MRYICAMDLHLWIYIFIFCKYTPWIELLYSLRINNWMDFPFDWTECNAQKTHTVLKIDCNEVFCVE